MIGTKPLISRLEEMSSSRSNFGAVVPPSLTGDACGADRDRLRRSSIRWPHRPMSPSPFLRALAAVSSALTALVDGADAEAQNMLISWLEYRERISGFFKNRKETRQAFLHSEDRRLIIEARAAQTRIQELKIRQGQIAMEWNQAEQAQSARRAQLLATTAAQPNAADPWAFVLPEEVEAGQAQISEAQAAVDRGQEKMQPLQSRMSTIANEIRERRAHA